MQSRRRLGAWAALAIALIGFHLAEPALVLLCGVIAPDLFRAAILPIALPLDRLSLFEYYAAALVFAVWLYRAGCNAQEEYGEELEFSPASRIWWFVVPFLNLIKPFEGMRELWNVSTGEPDRTRNHPLVTGWWALWLATSATNYWILFTRGNPDAAYIATWGHALLGVPAGSCAIALVHRITQAQRRPVQPRVDEVFA